MLVPHFFFKKKCDRYFAVLFVPIVLVNYDKSGALLLVLFCNMIHLVLCFLCTLCLIKCDYYSAVLLGPIVLVNYDKSGALLPVPFFF